MRVILLLLTVFALLPFLGTHKAYAQGKTPPSLVKIIHKPSFSLPLDCTYGVDCWILNYADRGPDKDGAETDLACAHRTYDGHKGVDFALPDLAARDRGVAVRAGAAGTVLKARDGQDDHFPLTEEEETAIKTARTECGNAVLIDHGDGWQSLSCHMKRGSIAVKPGQKVKAGDKIGMVGSSGLTQFPHLHFGLTHNGAVIDPLTGADIATPCGRDKGASLFSKSLKIAYEPLVITTAGFKNAAPTMEELEKDSAPATKLSASGKSLVFYAIALGVREKDSVALTILDPRRKTYAAIEKIMDKDRARQMLFAGRAIPENAPLEAGTYTGRIVVKRSGKDGKDQIFEKESLVEIE